MVSWINHSWSVDAIVEKSVSNGIEYTKPANTIMVILLLSKHWNCRSGMSNLAMLIIKNVGHLCSKPNNAKYKLKLTFNAKRNVCDIPTSIFSALVTMIWYTIFTEYVITITAETYHVTAQIKLWSSFVPVVDGRVERIRKIRTFWNVLES